jgi:NADH-quinone oxidoreductase subunit L
MEGPTPVSGLIHSATMVIAGVFLIIQTFNIIKLNPELLLLIMVLGTVTTLITSLVAATSFDIKRVIANSTASHIGLMFMSLGLGDLSISLFHLTTHAYFKAFGFLFAGFIIHLLHNEQDCRLMGGIFNLLPLVSILEEYWCITMLNLPNSSSYYSKELFFNSY